MRFRWLANYGPAFVLTVALLAIWEIVARTDVSVARLLPSLGAIERAFAQNWDVIYNHTIQTLLETVLGLFVATTLGLLLAVILDISSWSRRAVYPLLIVSQTIPIVALAPLLLIWFGFDIG